MTSMWKQRQIDGREHVEITLRFGFDLWLTLEKEVNGRGKFGPEMSSLLFLN